jgi:hypothetical protein
VHRWRKEKSDEWVEEQGSPHRTVRSFPKRGSQERRKGMTATSSGRGVPFEPVPAASRRRIEPDIDIIPGRIPGNQSDLWPFERSERGGRTRARQCFVCAPEAAPQAVCSEGSARVASHRDERAVHRSTNPETPPARVRGGRGEGSIAGAGQPRCGPQPLVRDL